MTRALAITLALFGVVLAIALLRYSPPAALGADVAPDRFSAARAREVQRAIAGDGTPRDVGSEASAKARAFLVGELERSGWKTETQVAMSCSRHAACARIANIVATRPGRDPGAAGVLLMAHYDSVPCSPGASDDGVGTATVIEAARAIASAPQLRRPVVIVLTDGEEAGLLGAEAFARSHPLAATVHGAVNIDSRGSTGPSAMFETSIGNAWIIGRLARSTDRPVTSSLFYEIYRRMPNDTDFTAVKDRVHGVNFANIARIEHYHTPLDSLANADLGTLQHHGDQALAMVRTLAEAGPELELPRKAANDAVWFDVLAFFIVRWPAAASLGLASAALALILGWAIRMRAWGLGLLAPLAALIAALAAALLVGLVLKLTGALPVPWVAHPLLALVSLHLTCFTAGLAAAQRVARGARPEVLWAGTWLTWGALGVAVAFVAPGASFLFVVPAFVAGFVAWLRIDVATMLPALVAAVVWLPIAVLSYDGLGLAIPALACISSIFLVSTLPALGNAGPRRLGLSAAAAVAVAVVAAAIVPKYSADKPQRVNVVFRQDESIEGAPPSARVYVEAAWAYLPWGKPPEPMVRALGATAQGRTEAPTPWGSPVPFADVPHVAMLGPSAIVRSAAPTGGGRSVRVALQSQRGARTIALVLPPGRRTSVLVENVPASPRNDAIVFRGVPTEGIELTITGEGQDALAVTIFDVTPGLPSADVAPIANAVRDARTREAVQTQEGDVTIAARHLEL